MQLFVACSIDANDRGVLLWRDRGCAVGVHDRQDSGIGRRIAVGSRNSRPVGRSQYIAQTHKIEWPAL
jgi:hypothetical protein